MAVSLDAARLLTYRAAWLKDSGKESVIKEASFAKLFATEAAFRIVNESLQIHGGAGLEKGHPVERLYREVRALTIYEGTSEIQRQTIARQLLREGGRP
jgi:alkylation response protein AidB-like acyl-CoA dehydrogenase